MKSISTFIVILFMVLTPSFVNAEIRKCGYCGGTGHIRGVYTAEQCLNCNGTGKVYVQNSNTNGRTVNGYTMSGNQFYYFGNVTYFANGIAYVANYNMPLKIYASPVSGVDYYVILTLPNYTTINVYFNR